MRAVRARSLAGAAMSPARARSLAGAVALAVASLIGFLPALAPAAVAAATPSLTMIGATTYDVLPDEGRVAVTVDLTVTNHLKNSVTKRFFFRTAFLTVLPGTSAFHLTGPTGTPRVQAISTTPTYTNLKLDFGTNLAAGKSTTLTLTYSLVDPGGAPDRPVRISPSLVLFSAWAVATPATPGASVDVRFPNGYDVTVRRGPLEGPVAVDADHEKWSSGPLASPLDYVVDIAADRPTDFVETAHEVDLSTGPATVLVRAWPDDPAWRDRVGDLVERALPILEREIGVPWRVDGPLAIHEALVRATGGYAGLFDPAQRRIDIAYAAPDGVILHELAHAWFNGGLVADRWAAEAFASYYAGLAAAELGVDPAAPALPDEPSDDAIPLNAWGPSGSVSVQSEAWAYAASLDLARQIAKRAGPDGLREVWSAAARGLGAYQPDASAVELAPSAPDWRGLLDLLEDATGTDFVDLWRTWVARPEDLQLLTNRAIARGYYMRSVALAGDWHLPPETRGAMRAWQFEMAGDLLAAADAVTVQRRQIEATAVIAGAALPGRLKTAFEGSAGTAAAAAEATVEQATLDAIVAAQAARPTEDGAGERLIIAIGLIADDPDARLSKSLAAFAAGDLQVAYDEARDADAAWSTAPQVGRSRIVSTTLLLIALILLVGIVRERRRRGVADQEPTGT
jgi:hypothetical protein